MIAGLIDIALSSTLGRIAAAVAVATVTASLTWPLAHAIGHARGKEDSALRARAERAEAEVAGLRLTAAAHRAAALADARAAGEARATASALQEKIRDLTSSAPAAPCLDAALSGRVRDLFAPAAGSR